MAPPLLTLLQTAPEGEVEKLQKLYFEFMPEAWVLGLVIVPAILAVAFLAYRRPKRDRRLRRVLAGLRTLLFATAVLLALGPFLRETRRKTEPAPLALVFDDSASLQHRDTLEPAVVESLREQGLTQEGQPRRLDLVQALAASDWTGKLAERYSLSAYRFAERLAPTSTDGAALTAKGAVTAVGDSLMGLVAENRGRRLPDVVLITDGRSNHGASVAEASTRLASEGVRVHVVALGDPRPAPDLAVERVKSPDLVLAGDEALFLLRVRATGEGIPPFANVRLRDELGGLLDEGRVELAGDAGAQVALSVRLDDPGERRLTAEVDVLEGETAQENNRLDLPIEVKEVKIRVLYVDGYSRWEYRFLKNRLLRATADIQVRCWLADAGRDFIQEASEGLEPLKRIPTSLDDLLRDYDVVILGDVDPADLNPDPLAGARFVEAVAEFVKRGGGLLMIAGPRHNPKAYVGTVLEPLLPVLLGREPAFEPRLYHPVPDDPLAPHPVTMLAPDPQDNQRLWEGAEGLWWYHPVERLRPGSQAWLVHPQNSNQHGQHVIAAGGYVPEGWVGWIGTDETWRWRFPAGERYVERFWRAALRNLAAARLRGEEGRARIDLDRTRVVIGEPLTVEARMRDEAYLPLVLEEGVTAFLEGREKGVQLAPVPGQPGIYRGVLRAAETGSHQVVLTEDADPDGVVLASARFSAVLPSLESRVASQDPVALREISGRTGGTLVPIQQADRLLDRLDGSERLSRTLASRDLPLDGPPLLILFLALACAEWLLRKRTNLS